MAAMATRLTSRTTRNFASFLDDLSSPKKKRAKRPLDPKNRAQVKKRVLEIFEEHYSPVEEGSELLALAPSSFDADPGNFNDVIEQEFGVLDMRGTMGSLNDLIEAIVTKAGGKAKAR